jgi:hypothetical protein
MFLKTIRRLNPVLICKPCEELGFRRLPSFPNALVHGGGNRPEELNFISGLSRVLSVGREPPTNAVYMIVMEGDFHNECPKLHKMREVIHSKRVCRFNLSAPTLLMQGLRNFPILPLGGGEDKRCKVDGLSSSKPWCLPKWCFLPVPNLDRSSGVKKFHVFKRARVTVTHPYLSRILPLKPRPTEARVTV